MKSVDLSDKRSRYIYSFLRTYHLRGIVKVLKTNPLNLKQIKIIFINASVRFNYIHLVRRKSDKNNSHRGNVHKLQKICSDNYYNQQLQVLRMSNKLKIKKKLRQAPSLLPDPCILDPFMVLHSPKLIISIITYQMGEIYSICGLGLPRSTTPMGRQP